MRLNKSYTCKISGNMEKVNFLKNNFEIIEQLSWYATTLGNYYDKRWFYNLGRLYHQCRKYFPELDSKLLQNFLRLHFIALNRKMKPVKPPKPSICLDYQKFNIRIDKSTHITNLWLRFCRKNFPLFGKYLFKQIPNFSKVKFVKIYQKHNNFYCKLVYVNEVENKVDQSTNFKNSKAVGLDINAKRLVLSNNKFYSLKKLYHTKIEYYKNNLRGHNIKNITRDVAHKLTTQIVKDLQFKNVEVLILEDLTNLRRQKHKGKKLNYIINSLPFAIFRDMLTYKCLDSGIRVKLINPKNTSKTCSLCGSLDTQRPTQNKFICSCGYKLDADLNASRNIWSRYMHTKWATNESCP